MTAHQVAQKLLGRSAMTRQLLSEGVLSWTRVTTPYPIRGCFVCDGVLDKGEVLYVLTVTVNNRKRVVALFCPHCAPKAFRQDVLKAIRKEVTADVAGQSDAS